jgi:hypothetical protein
MVGNEPVRDVHHLDEVDLIPVRRFSWILPDQLSAIGEERSGSIPKAKIVPKPLKPGIEERSDFGFPPQDTLGLVLQCGQDQRGFQDSLVRVERHQAIQIAADYRFVPPFINMADFGVIVSGHRLLPC